MFILLHRDTRTSDCAARRTQTIGMMSYWEQLLMDSTDKFHDKISCI